MVLAVLAVATHFPVSYRAEHVFLRLQGRFFRDCAYLASTLQWDRANPPTRWQRLGGYCMSATWRKVPGQARHLGKCAAAAALGESTTEGIQAVVDSLQALAYRMQDLIETRATPQSQLLAHELLSQVHASAGRIADIFRNLSQHPEAADFADFRRRLDAMLGRLEEQIANAVAGADHASIATRENENSNSPAGRISWRVGGVREFREAVGQVDWDRLREVRF